MYKPGVDCIVVNYKTPRDLKDFGDSFVRSHHDLDFPETLWICNVQPETADTLAAEWTSERCVESHTFNFEQNVGYAGAVNHAAQLGKREVIAIFNADVILSARTVYDCSAELLNHSRWGVVGPKQTDEHDRITHAGIFGTRDKPKMRGWKERDQGQYNDVREDAVSVSGSAYFIKRSVWDELHSCPNYQKAVIQTTGSAPVGAFLPTPHYYRCEETFCSSHAISHGWQIAFLGTSSAIHKWHKASPVGGVAEKEHMPESREMFRNVCDKMDIEHD